MPADTRQALQRVHWAREAIARLALDIEEYYRSSPLRIKREPTPGQPGYSRDILTDDPRPVPSRIPLRTGDAIHSLRTSLDYLAFKLVSSPTKQTEFPVGVSPKDSNRSGYRLLVGSRLKTATAAVIRAVSALEAYLGGANAWIADLHSLDIVDKHHLPLLTPMVCRSVGFDVTPELRKLSGRTEIPSLPVFIKGAKLEPFVKGAVLSGAPNSYFEAGNTISYRADLIFASPAPKSSGFLVETLLDYAERTDSLINRIGTI